MTITLSNRSKALLENPGWQELEKLSLSQDIAWKAEKDKSPCGTLSAELRIDKHVKDKELREKDRYVYLANMKVQGENDPVNEPSEVGKTASENMRNQGIGSSLLSELETIAINFGATRIEGKVIKTNLTTALRRFYEKNGYEITKPSADEQWVKIVKRLQEEQVREARHSEGRAKPLYQFFTQARERAAKWAVKEEERTAREGQAWPVYDSGVEAYERAFRSVLDRDFRTLLEQRLEKKGKIFVLDVMGTGGFLDAYPDLVTGEVAITLIDHRSVQEKETDLQRGKVVIAGADPTDLSADVLRNTPWLKAQKYLEEHDDTDMPGFDLTTIIPGSGWEALAGFGPPNDQYTRLVTWLTLQRAYSLASPNGGTLLAQELSDNFLPWAHRLRTIRGIRIRAHDLNLKITKKANPPARLPRI